MSTLLNAIFNYPTKAKEAMRSIAEVGNRDLEAEAEAKEIQEREDKKAAFRARWELDREREKQSFYDIRQAAAPENYKQVPMGEYPQESDEVWVEAWSGDAAVRGNDLFGFVQLAELRKYLLAAHWIVVPEREAIKGGCQFPVGSVVIKFARRAK